MLFESDGFPDSWKKKHLFKESVLCVLSHDGSIVLLNYINRSSVDDDFISSFRKVWFLEKKDRQSSIRCIWEAKRLGASPDMVKGLMNEWGITEADVVRFGKEIHHFNCDRCKFGKALDAFGAYCCQAEEALEDLWVQVRPRKSDMPAFPALFYPEEIAGTCLAFIPV